MLAAPTRRKNGERQIDNKFVSYRPTNKSPEAQFMSIDAARKSLQQEFAALSMQANRVEAALRALDGEQATAQPARKKNKLSPARRRVLLVSLKKARAAKAAKKAENAKR
jgi:hypothetical protein